MDYFGGDSLGGDSSLAWMPCMMSYMLLGFALASFSWAAKSAAYVALVAAYIDFMASEVR